MRILRNIVVGSVFGGSALAIAFACVDRLDHPAPVRSAAPVAALTRIRPPDPAVTGSLPVESGPSISDILGREAGARDAGVRVSNTRDSGPKGPGANLAVRTATPKVATPREVATSREAAAKVAPKLPPVKKTAEGFDSERLNALMRGDPAVTLTRSR